MKTLPQIGDVWYPKPDAKYASPPFMIVETRKPTLGDDTTYHKCLWIQSKQWCWYGNASITTNYYLVARI